MDAKNDTITFSKAIRHFILGTAGHIDHGKTTLIKALTGIDTDRLPEEKTRGLSIDLGFAHLTLPSGRIAGIVDVPGHNRFLKNMLAGVGGFDLGILVIDAREGPRAQTQEHLDILELVALSRLVVAATKIDLLDVIELGKGIEKINLFIKQSRFSNAPIIPVSSITGQGIQKLIDSIDNEINNITLRDPLSSPRLPIDRIFHVAGFGTVVTGTLLSGTIKQNDKMQLLPIEKEIRIRHLEVYGNETDTALAGSRVAANIVGIEPGELKRGMVLLNPGGGKPSQFMEGKLTLLKNTPLSIKDGSQIRLYIHTAEYLAHIFLFDKKELNPGEESFVHFRLTSPGIALSGDHFIVRSSSPLYTLGGGIILEPYATRSKKSDKLEKLQIREGADIKSRIINIFQTNLWPNLVIDDISNSLSIPADEIAPVLKQLQNNGIIQMINNSYLFSRSITVAASTVFKTITELAERHRFKQGFAIDDIHARSKLPNCYVEAALNALVKSGSITEIDGKIAPNNHTGELPANLSKMKDKILDDLYHAQFSPPPLDYLAKEYRIPQSMLKEIKTYLIERDKIVFISDEIAYPKEILEKAKSIITDFIKKNSSVTPAQTRDLLGASRKYIIPLLEYFDRIKLTIRKEDARVLRNIPS